MVSGPPSQYTPEALNEMELRTVTGQAIQVEGGLGRKHFRNSGGLMPGGIVNGEDYGRVERGGIRPRDGAQMAGKGVLQAGRFGKPCAPLRHGRTLH